jgi:hypothetical protein
VSGALLLDKTFIGREVAMMLADWLIPSTAIWLRGLVLCGRRFALFLVFYMVIEE